MHRTPSQPGIRRGPSIRCSGQELAHPASAASGGRHRDPSQVKAQGGFSADGPKGNPGGSATGRAAPKTNFPSTSTAAGR